MALTLTYGGWRRESGLAAQRATLILHIEEIESRVFGLQAQKALDQEARSDLATLERMLERREQDLKDLDDDIAHAAGDSDLNPFVSVRPVQ